ncbi:MAG: YkgJ family cysteine cluster protein, partial [Candidatus Bathyarchaeia archaeon]
LFQFHCQLIMNHLKDLCKDCSMCCEICDIDLNPYDVERMAKFLKITEEQFVSKYCIPHPEEPSFFYRLKQKPCPFLKDKRCLIYQVRPNNCVFYPFLSSLQKEALQTYQKTKKVSINVPTWCHSAMKVKEFDDKIREIIRNAPKEEIESLQKHARTVLEKMARDYSYINFG